MLMTQGTDSIAVFNVDGRLYAINDVCPHEGGPLSEGMLDGTQLTCPWHGWSFELARPWDAPPDGVERYRVRQIGDEIQIELPE
jgi:nitrite reductase/ring-hydroxylating ferredoxin subunit